MADSVSNMAFAENTTKIAQALHAYYPLDAEIAGYVVNEWGMAALLTVFFGTCAVLFSATYFVAKSFQPKLSRGELLTIMWFVLSGAIHLFFEGYYAANFRTLGAHQTIIGQLWKEYAFSDSRYLTNDSMVLCMETVTAVCWGPGCLLVAAMVVFRHPMRYPIQLLVSIGQIYGDVLYYATCAFEHYIHGITYSRPGIYYFWFYFIFMNAIWMVIPGCKCSRALGKTKCANRPSDLVYQSITKSARAIDAYQRADASKKAL